MTQNGTLTLEDNDDDEEEEEQLEEKKLGNSWITVNSNGTKSINVTLFAMPLTFSAAGAA